MTEQLKMGSAENGKKTGDRTGVGFFFPLPLDLAAKFPSLGGEDKSPPHATFLYVGDVPQADEERFLAVSRSVLADLHGSVRAHLGPLEYFVHPAKERRVAVLTLRFSHDMAALRWKLRDALVDAGFQVDDSFPLVYRPHVTLAYLEDMVTDYEGLIPTGDWAVSGIEVWGLPRVVEVPFSAPGVTAGRHLKAMTHQRSVALMKFLSGVARKLGVGDQTYVVGGAVRNWIIKEPIKDIDVVIDPVALKRPDASDWFARQVASAIPVETSHVTNNYGVAILTVSGDWLLDGESMKGVVIEIANARKESYGGAEGKGYKPHMVEPATIEEDTARREFTFNTLLWRLHDLANGPDKAEILDLTGCGMKDLTEGWMRCPSSPDQTFSDDPSRMVRAIKFLLKYGFKIDPEVEASIKRNKEKLRNIPGQHLSNMLLETFFEAGIGKKALLEMDKLGLLEVIQDIARTDKVFRSALANWADSKASVEFLFDLMDLGMPSGKRLSFLDAAQKDRVREITVQMSAAQAETFLGVLEQPGRVIDMGGLITEFGLKGPEIRQLTWEARTRLLDNPLLIGTPERWEDKIRGAMGKTAKTFTLNVGDPVLYGKWKNLRGVIKDFGVSEKGDPTVTIAPPFPSKKQEKTINLFKLRYDEEAAVNGEEPSTILAARWLTAAKFKDKKKVKTQDGDEVTIYEYSERQVQNRNKAKAEQIEKLRHSIGDLRKQVQKDLTSDDDHTRAVALAVGLMDATYERVGNDESAKDGHFGVTGWKVKHVTFSKGKATIKYVGKSGVDHEKVIDTAASVKALKDAVKGKGDNDDVVDCNASDVNEYLRAFDITAKDIRGYHANTEMQERLKAVRSKGGKLPTEKKDREKQLKAEFKEALEGTAEAVGHEPATLKSQYLVPGLEDEFLKDGKVTDSLVKKGRRQWERPQDGYWVQVLDITGQEKSRHWVDEDFKAARETALRQSASPDVGRVILRDHANLPMQAFTRGHQIGGPARVAHRYLAMLRQRTLVATKTHSEVEDEEAERLVRPEPKKKPPRQDLRRENMKTDSDPDLATGVEKDHDLSLNYKKVAREWLSVVLAKKKRKGPPQPPKGPKGPTPPKGPAPPKPEGPPTPPGGPEKGKSDDPPEHKAGDVWQSEHGWAAKNPEGKAHVFPKKEQAEAFAKGEDPNKAKEEKGAPTEKKDPQKALDGLADALKAGSGKGIDKAKKVLLQEHPELADAMKEHLDAYDKASKDLTRFALGDVPVGKKEKKLLQEAADKAGADRDAAVQAIRDLGKQPEPKEEETPPEDEVPEEEAPEEEAPEVEEESWEDPEDPKSEDHPPPEGQSTVDRLHSVLQDPSDTTQAEFNALLDQLLDEAGDKGRALVDELRELGDGGVKDPERMKELLDQIGQPEEATEPKDEVPSDATEEPSPAPEAPAPDAPAPEAPIPEAPATPAAPAAPAESEDAPLPNRTKEQREKAKVEVKLNQAARKVTDLQKKRRLLLDAVKAADEALKASPDDKAKQGKLQEAKDALAVGEEELSTAQDEVKAREDEMIERFHDLGTATGRIRNQLRKLDQQKVKGPDTTKMEKGGLESKFHQLTPEAQEQAADVMSRTTASLSARFEKGGLDADLVREVVDASNKLKSPGLSAAALGEAMAKVQFAQAKLTNPMTVTELKPLNPPPAEMEKISQDSMARFSQLTPELRADAFRQMASELAKLEEGTPRHDQLSRVLDGLQLASLAAGDRSSVREVDGKTLLPEPSGQLKAFLTLQKNSGDDFADLLKTDFYGPEGRNAVEARLDQLDDSKLTDFFAEDDKELAAALKEIMRNAKLPWQKELIRGMMTGMVVDSMTTMHKSLQNQTDQPAQAEKMFHDIMGSVKEAQSEGMQELTSCLEEHANLPPDEAKAACMDTWKAVRLKGTETFLDQMEKKTGIKDLNDPLLVQMQSAIAKGDPRELDILFRKVGGTTSRPDLRSELSTQSWTFVPILYGKGPIKRG